MMIWRFVCAVAFIAGVTPSLAQREVPVSPDPPARVYDYVFPMEFDGAKRLSIRGYDDPALGYSVGYQRGAVTATIYIYDSGVKAIPDNPDAAMVMAEFRASIRDVVELRKARLHQGFVLPDARKVERLNCAWLTYSADAGGMLCLGAAKGKFIKFRTSAPETQDGVRESALFVMGWMPIFWPPT